MTDQVEYKKLAIPAPRREWYRTDNGWASRPWTNDAKRAYEVYAVFNGTQDRAGSLEPRTQSATPTCRCDKHKRNPE